MSDAPDELEPDLAALLGADRDADELSATRREAIRARLEAAILAPPPNGSGGSGGSGATGGSGGSGATGGSGGSGATGAAGGGLAKVLGLLMVGGALGAALHAGLTPRAPEPSVVPTSGGSGVRPVVSGSLPAGAGPAPEDRIPTATPADLPSVAPGPSGAPARPGASAASAASTASASSASGSSRTSLAEERALVERGRAALVRRDGAAALEALRDHARRFPAGQLAEERDALSVQALAASGRADEASRKATEFRRSYPTSVFLPRVEESVRPAP